MRQSEEICRVLIVDDELDYAAETARAIDDCFRNSRFGTSVRIELSNSAAFVAARIEESAPDDPPWDVILADVVMPRPARSPNDPIDTSAEDRVRSLAGRRWRCWEYPYSYSSHIPEIDHGGLYLADRIARMLSAGGAIGPLKLVLISRRLMGSDRRRMYELRTRHRAWLDYYDKSPWEDSDSWDTALPRGIFQWALIQAIRGRSRDSWGGAALERIPCADYLAHSSTEIDRLLVESRVRAEDDATNVILIAGEPGVGRLALARFVHAMRHVGLAHDGPFTGVDAWAVPGDRLEEELFGVAAETIGASTPRLGATDKAATGTLFLHEISKLAPHVQGRLLRLVEDGRFCRVGAPEEVPFQGSLIVLTAEDDLDHQVEIGVLDRRLRDRLAAGRLRIPPLRERPDDIVPLAYQALRRLGGTTPLTQETESWLQEREYQGNARELFQLIRGAVLRSPAATLTVDDLSSTDFVAAQSVSVPANDVDKAGPATTNILLRETPELWRLRFRGGTVAHVPDRIGIEAVAQLLARPHQWIGFDALEGKQPHLTAPSSTPSQWALKEAGVSLEDRQGRSTIDRLDFPALVEQRRYLESERVEAERNNDQGKLADIREMIESIEDEVAGRDVSGALALGRQVMKSRRDRIMKRIKRACSRLDSAVQGSGEHILSSIKRRSDAVAYCPEPDELWHVAAIVNPRRSGT